MIGVGLKAVRLLKGPDVKAAAARGGLSGGGAEGGKGGGRSLGDFCLGWGGIGGGNGSVDSWEWACWAFFLLSSWSCCNGFMTGPRLQKGIRKRLS